MARIVDNRICYKTHNVVLEHSLFRNMVNPMDYLLEMEAGLTPEGDARLHKAQLDSFNNDGSWEIEKPKLTITPFHDSEKAEIRCEIPTKMLATVTLHNGNFNKVICAVHCARSESFYPLYGTMEKLGIDVGRKARRDAETEYFKQYDALVAAAN